MEARVRRWQATLLTIGLAALLAVAPTATPQDGGQPHYWPHRTFSIPVNVDRINQGETKPSQLQIYSSLNRGPWQAGAKLPLNGLQDLGEGKKGFKFTADRGAIRLSLRKILRKILRPSHAPRRKRGRRRARRRTRQRRWR